MARCVQWTPFTFEKTPTEQASNSGPLDQLRPVLNLLNYGGSTKYYNLCWSAQFTSKLSFDMYNLYRSKVGRMLIKIYHIYSNKCPGDLALQFLSPI